MKKSLYILSAIFIYVIFSFTSVYAEAVIPMVAVTYRMEAQGRYKALEGVTYSTDSGNIDFTYKTTVDDIEKVYTTSIKKDGNVFSYAYSGAKTGVDAYYQALLNNIAVETVFYAVGEANGLSSTHLSDMAKDFSKFNYTNYGLEATTFEYTNTINGEQISIKVFDSFKINASELSITGTANIEPSEDKTPAPVIVEKEQPIKSIITYTLLAFAIIVIILITIKVIKNKKK